MSPVLLLGLALAGVTFEAPPEPGGQVGVVVTAPDARPAAGATVRAIVGPGLPTEREVAIGITDARGRVLWQPDASGRVSVRADEQVQDVLVAWVAPPTDAVVMLALLVATALGALLRGARPARLRGEAPRS